MPKLILTSILSALFSINTFAFCKINQYGHNICTGEKALLIVSENDEVNKKFKVVQVKSIFEAESTAIVSGKKKAIHLDKLMGNKLCDSNEPVCEGQKVQIKSVCPNLEKKEVYKVSKVYETQRDDVVEISTGSLIWKKSFLADANCVDLVE